MVSDAQTKSIGLFFLLTSSDEKSAFQGASRAVAKAKSSAKSDREIESSQLIKILMATHQTNRKTARNAAGAALAAASNEPAVKVPSGLDFEVWNSFRKSASETEMIALLLNSVLGFSENAVAEGLDVSVGTIRHRMMKATRQLGSLLKASI